MTEDENFLARWSRRKGEAAAEGAKREEKSAPPQAADSKAPPAESPDAPVVDLSKLPKVDDISAETDVSAFLQQGIPADLTRAALRRAWSSDPAIRDFVGLQENDWVFNKPGPDQGFGPLGPETDVGKLLAQVFGEPPKEEPPPSANQEPHDDAGRPAEAAPIEAAAVTSSPPSAQNDASHNESESASGQSHGGAQPRPVSET